MSELLERIEAGIDKLQLIAEDNKKQLNVMQTQLFTTHGIPGLIDKAIANDAIILERVETIEKTVNNFILTRRETCPALKALTLRKTDTRFRRWRKQDVVIAITAISIPTVTSAISLILSITGAK